ncbi:MAG: hypothetical protein WBA89_02430 [Microcoleus sp.]|uniref:type II toxin-antitoxin system VapB15 family antitoxin n=1 Tax=Microcoleus sp. TaxID=44472 RepID=UPI003C75D089
MTLANYQLSLNFEQIVALVKQLPYPEKLQLSQELEKEVLNSKLTVLLESLRTEELSLETIAQEVEAVRSEIHARKTNH